MIVDSLLRAGADPNVTQQAAIEGSGGSALHLAIQGNNSKMVELLIQHGAKTEPRDNKDQIPLLAALDRHL